MSDQLDESLKLSPVEARVVGCLIEKAATTPETYPLTVNALVLAANQKTNRDPILNLEEGEIGHALRELEDRGWVRVVHGSRALRYEHRVDEKLSATRSQRALLCLLFLRGPQTAPELLMRVERLADIASLEDLRQVLERLQQRGFVRNIGRAAGQREDRYASLFCGEVAAVGPIGGRTDEASGEPGSPSVRALLARIEQLERRVARLESDLGIEVSSAVEEAPTP